MLRVARRLDLGELRPATRREDGTLRVQAHITRCGVFNYLNPDGSVRRELRLPEDVFDTAALSSFNGVPVTDDHPPEMLDAHNARKYAVGALMGTPIRDDDHVRGDLAIYDGDVVGKLPNKNQVSAGYTCDLEEVPGVHPTYGHYDAIQRNIRGNHIAIVDTARAGNSARIRLDAASVVMDEWSDAAREASAEARRAAAGRAGEDANRASIQAHSSGKGHDKAAALHRAAAAAAKAAGDKKGAKEHEAQAAEHDKAAKREAKPNVQFQNLRSEYEHKQAAQKFADLKRNAELAKYVTKKDAAILGYSSIEDLLDACKNHAIIQNMADALDRTDADEEPKTQAGKPADKDPDDKDEASRNARGENDAKPGKKAKKPAGAESEEVQDSSADVDDEDDVTASDENEDGLGGHGEQMDGQPQADSDDDSDDDDQDDDQDDDSDDDSDDDDQDDDEQEHDDAYTASYDDAGKLTAEARHKMATTSFAVPDREGLPIHDPDHTRAAMSRFAQFDFKDPEEKHAAFNRITKRAKHFGISSEGFEKAHRQTLDHQDTNMLKSEKIKAERARADKAETALAKAEGEIASLKKDLEAAKAEAKKARNDAADAQNKAVAARVDLITKALKTGAKVDTSMSTIEIKRAVVKHVDKEDVPADKPEAYVDALFDGALKRARQDAVETAAGAEALAEARKTAVTAVDQQKTDADDLDEAAALNRARSQSAGAWNTWAPKHRKEIA